MPEPISSATAALTVLSSALKITERLRDLVGQSKDFKLNQAVADLNLTLVDLKEQIVDLRKENLELKARLEVDTKAAELRPQLEMRHDGSYWFKDEPQDHPKGPFCSKCFDSDGRLSLMTHFAGMRVCRACGG